MKKTIIAALFFFLLFSCAHAEGLPKNSMVYEHPGYPMTVYSFTPLPDGSIVLAGQLRHKGEYRDMPEYYRYETHEMEILTDAVAVCLAPDGTKRWEIRLADPQAENLFYCQGLLPDGRLMMSFRPNDSAAFGAHHFIVSQEGIVEEMLPTVKIAETVSPFGLQLMPSGYLSDGADYVDSVYYDANYPSGIIMRDFDGNELWRYRHEDDSKMHPAYEVQETPDGFIVRGQTTESYLNYEGFIWKLDRNGKPLWEFTDGDSFIGADLLLLADDGGVIFAGDYDPSRPEDAYHADGIPFPTLTKLSADGKYEWTLRFDEIRWIAGAAVFGEGYVLTGGVHSDMMLHEYMLLYVDAEGKTIKKQLITGDDGLIPWIPDLLQAENGDVFVYANLAEPDDPITRWSGDVKKFFFAKLDASNIN